MQPRKSILDRTFRYTSAECTNIRRTFWRVRYEREQAKRAETTNTQPLRMIK